MDWVYTRLGYIDNLMESDAIVDDGRLIINGTNKAPSWTINVELNAGDFTIIGE